MKLEGGCYCGEVRYKAEGEPMMKAQCHCRECQYITGGGPNMFMLMPIDGLQLHQGRTEDNSPAAIWKTPVTREFCAECGTHLITRPARPARRDPEGRHAGRSRPVRWPAVAIYTIDQAAFPPRSPRACRVFERLPNAVAVLITRPPRRRARSGFCAPRSSIQRCAGIGVGAAALAIDRHQRRLDVRLHLAAVAADIDDRALLDQAPDAILLRRDQMLHIGLRALAARERGVQFGDAVGGERLQLVGVEIILLGMTAAEEQHRRAERSRPWPSARRAPAGSRGTAPARCPGRS